ncbi:MAG: ferredoxin reductase family protein [Bacillota bacterium]
MKARKFSLAITGLLLLTFVFWAVGTDYSTFEYNYLRQIGLLLAALGLVMLFIQFVLASRIKRIETGLGLDRMFRWHRFFGRAGLAALTGHAILIVTYRITAFGELFPTTFIWIGLVVLLGFMITASLASTYRIIGLAYEIWRNIHLLNYLLFPLALIHVFYHTTGGSALYYLWVLLAFLYTGIIIYRIYCIVTIRFNPYEVTAVREEAKDIWTLEFSGKKLDFLPGQFMFVQLLRSGKLSSAHPFTISNSPTRENLSITPKKLGDFTLSIKDTRVGDKAFIDAAYGVFSFLNYRHEELVFIAGGIGITPFISMLRYIRDKMPDQKVTLFWINRNENYLCFRDELEELECELDNFRLVIIMSDQPDWEGEKGHLNAAMIQGYLESFDNKEFFVCGPPDMTATIIFELKERQVPPARIHSELFRL